MPVRRVPTIAVSAPSRKRGRPPGSKNKSTLTASAIGDLRTKIAPFLTTEDMDYLTRTLEGTDPSVLSTDMDIVLGLALKGLLPALGDEIRSGQLSREGTQRLATVKELLALRFQMEKREKGDDQPNNVTFIQNIFAQRNFDPASLARLVGSSADDSVPVEDERRLLPRVVDGDGPKADETGTVSNPVSKRPIEVSAGREISTDRLLMDYLWRSDPQDHNDSEQGVERSLDQSERGSEKDQDGEGILQQHP